MQVFWLYIRQCAGFSVGKGMLDALFPGTAIRWAEAYTLAHGPTARQLADTAAEAHGVRLVALRHPVDRVVAQLVSSAILLPRWA